MPSVVSLWSLASCSTFTSPASRERRRPPVDVARPDREHEVAGLGLRGDDARGGIELRRPPDPHARPDLGQAVDDELAASRPEAAPRARRRRRSRRRRRPRRARRPARGRGGACASTGAAGRGRRARPPGSTRPRAAASVAAISVGMVAVVVEDPYLARARRAPRTAARLRGTRPGRQRPPPGRRRQPREPRGRTRRCSRLCSPGTASARPSGAATSSPRTTTAFSGRPASHSANRSSTSACEAKVA